MGFPSEWPFLMAIVGSSGAIAVILLDGSHTFKASENRMDMTMALLYERPIRWHLSVGFRLPAKESALPRS